MENSMNMNKLISLAIFASGVVLVVFGVAATESLSSDVSRFFTGSPTDKAIWMLIGGIVAIIIGWVVCCMANLREYECSDREYVLNIKECIV